MTTQAGKALPRRREIALDTNALGNLCANERDPASALVDAVRALDARLVLLPETLVESFVGHVGYSRKRAEMLAKVEAAIPGSCGIAITLDKLWRHEATGKKLSGTPVFEHARVAGLVQGPSAYNDLHDKHADEMTQAIGARRGRAGALEGQAEGQFKADTTKEQRRDRRELLADFAGERELCRGPLSGLLGGTRQDAADLLSDPVQVEQHRAHVLAAGLAAANGLRALFYGDHTPEAGWLKRDHGNWADARIVANAAYCDYFVTDDKGLTGGLEFLRESGFLGPTPICLSDLLAGDVGSSV